MSDADLRLTQLVRESRVQPADALRGVLSPKELRTRVADGRIDVPHAGVYVIGGGLLTYSEEVRAGALACGPDVVASHRSAAILHGLRGVTGDIVEVTGPLSRHARPEGVVAHRSRRLHPDLVTVREAVPVMTIGWTLCVLGAVVPPGVVERAAESAIQRGGVTTGGLADLLRAHGGRGVRGTGVLRAVLGIRPDGGAAGSDFEVDVLDVIRRFGLPTPVRQFPVALPGGISTTVDLCWPDRRVSVHPEGDAFHSSRRDRDWDREVVALLREIGWDPVRLGYFDPRRRPAWVATRLTNALARNPSSVLCP